MTAPIAPRIQDVPTEDVAAAPSSRAVFQLLRLGFAALMLLLAVLLLLPPLLGYPRYEVAGGVLTVRSITTHRTVKAGTLVQSVVLPPLTRSMGTSSGGVCVGRFRDVSRRVYELYTDCSSQVLLFSVPGKRPLAITPGDPQALLAALRSGSAATFHLPTPGISLESWLYSLPLLVLAALALWPWPALNYRLTPDALEVQRRLGVDRLPYGGLSVRPARSRLGLRLMGTSLPGYHTGLYATAGGQVMAAATSSHAPALLLTSRGVTYYVTPADPHALMAELGRRGATLLNE
ncbi:PH domain-containing protein [Deinococcus radiomollis]|uniref:PH domain-containing protein n=1 Tax=Deinococcus radiomollis TaxID=468916 RepID=UPI003892980A